MDIAKVISGIQMALSRPSAGKSWVRDFISGMSPTDLKWAVETGFDPVSKIIEEYQIYDPQVRKFAALIIRRYWRDISSELKDVQKIVDRLAKNPANREQLSRPETIQYLNAQCLRGYHTFYEIGWSPPVDLTCAHCGKAFPYDVLGCIAMDFKAVGERLRIVRCPNCGKDVKAVF